MLDSFQFSLNATMPVFLMMVAGFLLRRARLIDDHFAQIANRLVFRGTLPVMLFLDLYDTDIRHNFDGRYIGFCFLVTTVSICAVWFLSHRFLKDRSIIGEFVQCSYRSSAAILGAAFIMNIYGTSGMAPLMIIGSVPLYNIFAVSILMLESPQNADLSLWPRLKKSLIGILTNPIILGIAAGMAGSLINRRLPVIPEKVLSSFAGLTSPLGLIAMGAGFDFAQVHGKLRPAAAAALIKTVLLTAIFLPLAVLFGFRDQQLVALVIMLGSPTTMTSYIMVRNMGYEGSLTSAGIVFSTLASSVTLTFWIFLLKYLGLIL